jgi:hypothetical protein
MGHGAQVVDLIRPNLLYNANYVRKVRQFPAMQNEIAADFIRILVEVVYPVRIEEERPAFDAVNFLPFSKMNSDKYAPS